MKKIIFSIFIFFLIVSLSACQSSYYNTRYLQFSSKGSQLIERNHIAGNELVKLSTGQLDGRPIITASFVNIDDLMDSSSFGRITSQHVATQFTFSGYHVEEMLLRKNVYIKQQEGEFLLSRELRNISAEHNAQAVIVGTYAVGNKHVYVTAKVIDASNSKVVASYDYEILIDKDVINLLVP